MGEKLVKFADDGQDLTLLPISTVTTDELQPGTYTFAYHQMKGVWLTHCARIPEVNMKVYGETNARVQKSMKTFLRRPRNTGVLLEGEPGMGKSVFIKLIAAEAYKINMPVIVIKEDIPGMIDLLAKVHTKCLVIMDEFEKIFTGSDEAARNGDVSSQNKLLSLMDGMDDNKKLFIASVNDSWRVSRFMKNRPGRFFYCFQFNNLDQHQIKEYLEDRLTNKEILPHLVTSLVGHKVNYDSLAAIVEEVNAGNSVEETLQDLNLDKEASGMYDVRLTIDDITWSIENFQLNTGSTNQTIWLNGKWEKDTWNLRVSFDTSDIKLRGNSTWDEALMIEACNIEVEDGPNEFLDKMKNIGNLEFSPHKEYSGYRSYVSSLDM